MEQAIDFVCLVCGKPSLVYFKTPKREDEAVAITCHDKQCEGIRVETGRKTIHD